MNVKANVFAGRTRLSQRIAKIESGYDSVVNRLGRWMDERERAAHDLKINRKAQRLLNATAEMLEVMKRADEIARNDEDRVVDTQ